MEIREEISGVGERLHGDTLAADLQCSLFVAALRSYRHDTVLRPFPPMFTSDVTGHQSDNKDYRTLGSACSKLAPLQEILNHGIDKLDRKLLSLLYWTLHSKNFTVRSLPKVQFEEIQKLTGNSVPVPPPNYIFQLDYTDSANAKFEDIRDGRDLYYAYHGSRLENFHSILNMGLHAHMNKNSLFGEGTYLTSELSVAMAYAPTGTSWEGSMMGDKLGCLAVCEIIDDPSVKCQIKNNEENGGNRSRARVPGSFDGEVPEKYYIVRNNEMLRVKYVLVYAHGKPKRSSQPSWFYRHRFLLMMLLYGLLLICIGLYNSRPFRYFIQRLLRKS